MSIEARINVGSQPVSGRVVMDVLVSRDQQPIPSSQFDEVRWTYRPLLQSGGDGVEIQRVRGDSAVLWNVSTLASGAYRVHVDVTLGAESVSAEHPIELTIENGALRSATTARLSTIGQAVGVGVGRQARGAEPDLAQGRSFQMSRDVVVDGPVPVQLTRTGRPATEDEILWVVIRNTTNNMSFRNYMRFMDLVMCGDKADDNEEKVVGRANSNIKGNQLRLPFPGVDPYRQLKVATETFLQVYCGVQIDGLAEAVNANGRPVDTTFTTPKLRLPLMAINRTEEEARFGRPLDDLKALWESYTHDNILVDPTRGARGDALPYLAIVRAKLPEVAVRQDSGRGFDCLQILQDKLLNPCFIELIWSYWHEEGMLVQTLLKLADRFQNRRAAGDRDPLANLEIDPLRSLNSFFWGYLQDEQHRLGVRRRAHEYFHHYGISLHGKAVTDLRAADRRSKFLESFHNLLYQCSQFYRQEDDTTIVADGFPVMNALKETHYVLAQGAHNQFGDLPATARQEMLIEQWLLARPEMREFLGGRVMVPYPEVWMDRVDAMKTLQGWSDVSVVHFRDLGVYGEQILLSVRYGAWSTVNDPNQAANWARYWRPEVQAYLHAYRAVTGVDITADVTAPRELAARFLPPSVHLRNRLMEQARR